MGGRGLHVGMGVFDAQGRFKGVFTLTDDDQYQLSPEEFQMIMDRRRGTDAMKQAYAKALQDQMSISKNDAAKTVQDALGKAGISLNQGQSSEVAHALIMTGSLLGGGNLRTRLYRAGRLLGDFSAVKGGSPAVVQRIVRRISGKVSGRVFKKINPPRN